MSFSQCRLDALKSTLGDIGASAMYVRDVCNIEWLTGFEKVFDDEQAHAMFIPRMGGGACLHSDSRYITALEREAASTPVKVDAEVVAMSKWANAKYVDAFGDGTDGVVHNSRCNVQDKDNFTFASDCKDRTDSTCIRMAIEDSISLAEYRALEKAFSDVIVSDADDSPFLETQNLILRLRAIKGEDEIALMKSAQAVTDAAFDHICGFIKTGMTERQIQLELDDYMMRNGADSLAFPSIVASGANGASPHAIVSDKPVQAGECIVMDFGARRCGYCSDMTRTVFLGEPEGQMLKAWETLRLANESVQEMLKPGVTGKQAHELAEKVLADAGFEGRMGHGLGHGVGIQVHELPNLNTRNDKPLVPGNVVTVEPGIYIPGEFGMRLEDYGAVTDSGFERFTQSTHEMVVL